MNEIILINKPKGITSRDVVNKVSKILNTKKVGHNGTLDPIAAGVLVICTNRYTKLNNLLTSEYKEYIAVNITQSIVVNKDPLVTLLALIDLLGAKTYITFRVK